MSKKPLDSWTDLRRLKLEQNHKEIIIFYEKNQRYFLWNSLFLWTEIIVIKTTFWKFFVQFCEIFII